MTKLSAAIVKYCSEHGVSLLLISFASAVAEGNVCLQLVDSHSNTTIFFAKPLFGKDLNQRF